MQLHFEEFGQGPPLIILHGLFGSSDNWHSLSRRLGERFHVLAVDQRNHGRSPHSAEMNYPVMAQDVLKLMHRLGLSSASVLGHSMGGKTAMQLALHHPAQVSKLVVVDISPRSYSPRHGQIFAGLLALNLNAFHTRQEMEAALGPSIPDLAVRRFLLKSIGRSPSGGFYWKINLRDICENYGRLSEAVSTPAPFVKPTLFICGALSNYLRQEDIPHIYQSFPRAQFRTIPQASHWVHAEAPQAFLATVLEFLTTPSD
jgi:esterase